MNTNSNLLLTDIEQKSIIAYNKLFYKIQSELGELGNEYINTMKRYDIVSSEAYKKYNFNVEFLQKLPHYTVTKNLRKMLLDAKLYIQYLINNNIIDTDFIKSALKN